MKSRKEKELEYLSKYSEIPRDFNDRLEYLLDKLNINNEKKYNEILNKRDYMISNLYYSIYKVILYEEPEGSPRPRFRLVNRNNLMNEAMSNSHFVHVYSLTGRQDNMFFKRLMNTDELYQLNDIIYTPCDVDYISFHKTPTYFSKTDIILAEIGLKRPMIKPDFDNIEKKYSDMYNGNVWIDDTCVIRGLIDKYWSVLPRVEITLRFLNALYDQHQFKSISKKLNRTDLNYFDSKGNLQRGV